MTEQAESEWNTKNAQQMHNINASIISDEPCVTNKKGRTFARTDVRYWRKKVTKAKFKRAGVDYESPNYSTQIAFRGRRERFTLATPNIDSAASKAQSIYLSLMSNGWEATLERFKPQSFKPLKVATVGELIEAVRDNAGIRPATLNGYAIALRLIVSQLECIGDQPALDKNGNVIKDRRGKPVLLSRFDYRAGGRNAWASKVDAVKIDTLTSERVQQWKLDYLKGAGDTPDARRRAINSVNSNLRNARALFSNKAMEHVKNKLLLPDPLPFSGIKLESPPMTRYISCIDAREILADAAAALESQHHERTPSNIRVNGKLAATAPTTSKLSREQFKIIVLCLMCGLRKREADTLLWRQVDFKKGVMRIETTEYFQPKTEDSHAGIDLDCELLALMCGWKESATGAFVIESANPPRYNTHRANYRCERDFRAVNYWLKSKGVLAQKPVHELRKELGAVLASEQGIFAAKTMLRHSDIRLTSRYYTDKKMPIYSGIGSVLGELNVSNANRGSIPDSKSVARRG